MHVAVKITAAAPIAAATFGLWFTMFSPSCVVVHAYSLGRRRDLGPRLISLLYELLSRH
jgi:hypothetical protein